MSETIQYSRNIFFFSVNKISVFFFLNFRVVNVIQIVWTICNVLSKRSPIGWVPQKKTCWSWPPNMTIKIKKCSRFDTLIIRFVDFFNSLILSWKAVETEFTVKIDLDPWNFPLICINFFSFFPQILIYPLGIPTTFTMPPGNFHWFPQHGGFNFIPGKAHLRLANFREILLFLRNTFFLC